MTREIALHCMKSYSESHSDLCELCPIYGQTGSDHCFEDALEYVIKALEQEPQTFKWCETCKEYDQEKHCCHRWSKVIRDTVEEMKQEYIEREVLDKIRAEIIELRSKQNVGVLECLDIIDKYKTEMEK